MACWNPIFLPADSALTRNGRLRPRQAERDPGLAEFVQLVHPVTGAASYSWRRAMVTVPCQKCPGCEMAWRREWTVRATCETVAAPVAYPELADASRWFGTFTYSDRIKGGPPRVSVGERSVQTLSQAEWKEFEKRLRHHLEYWYPKARLRRFAVGEYGSKRLRPHVHALLWDLPLEDARVVEAPGPRRKHALWVSPSLTRLWGRGEVMLGKVTRASASYVAGYLGKAARWPVGAEDPWRLMSSGHGLSSRGGLGAAYFERYWPEMYRGPNAGLVPVGEPGDIRLMPAPRYFGRLLQERHPEAWLDWEARRLERVREARESVTAANVQARMSVVWDKLSRKSRDGTLLVDDRRMVPVQYKDGHSDVVEIVSRFDERVVVGQFGRETGFGLSDYLEVVARNFARDEAEVGITMGQREPMTDEDGNVVVPYGLVGELRRRRPGHVDRVGWECDASGFPLAWDEFAVSGAGPVGVEPLPGDVVEESGTPERKAL